VSEPVGHHIDQLYGAVEPLRVLQLRKIEQEIRPLVHRGEMVPAESVHVRRRMKPRGLDSAHVASMVFL
jgi:hypothetical protein